MTRIIVCMIGVFVFGVIYAEILDISMKFLV